jgi:hypothetical protein
MKIELNKINKFFLTHKSEEKKQHMLKLFPEAIEINPNNDVNLSKFKSGASGFINILLAAKNPIFMMLEDDVVKYRDFPEELFIPDNADILYIGLSSWGYCDKKNSGINNYVKFTDINEDLIQIYNMLSTHGLIVCSKKGMDILIKALYESYAKDVVWDIFIAQNQKNMNVYALKKPLVYQTAALGGQEKPTKVEVRTFSNAEDSISLIV